MRISPAGYQPSISLSWGFIIIIIYYYIIIIIIVIIIIIYYLALPQLTLDQLAHNVIIMLVVCLPFG